MHRYMDAYKKYLNNFLHKYKINKIIYKYLHFILNLQLESNGNICVYISAVKVNALTQIHFNGTNFINARLTQRIFSVWPVAQHLVGEMEMQCCQLSNIVDPFSDFVPFKNASKPYLVSENRRYCRARSCFPSTCTPLSLFTSAQVSVQRTAERSSALFQLNTDIMLLL